jgi:hypothetical protein
MRDDMTTYNLPTLETAIDTIVDYLLDNEATSFAESTQEERENHIYLAAYKLACHKHGSKERKLKVNEDGYAI